MRGRPVEWLPTGAQANRDFGIVWSPVESVFFWGTLLAAVVVIVLMAMDALDFPEPGNWFILLIIGLLMLNFAVRWLFMKRIVVDSQGIRVPTGKSWRTYLYGNISAITVQLGGTVEVRARPATNWRERVLRLGPSTWRLRLKDPEKFVQAIRWHLDDPTIETLPDGSLILIPKTEHTK